MTILHVALAKLDESCLQESREEAYRQIHRMMAEIPVPKQNVRVGPPINPTSTLGYNISADMFFSEVVESEQRLMHGYAAVLSITFDKYDDFKAYLKHPEHIKLFKRYGPALREMITYQVDGTAPESKL